MNPGPIKQTGPLFKIASKNPVLAIKKISWRLERRLCDISITLGAPYYDEGSGTHVIILGYDFDNSAAVRRATKEIHEQYEKEQRKDAEQLEKTQSNL